MPTHLKHKVRVIHSILAPHSLLKSQHRQRVVVLNRQPVALAPRAKRFVAFQHCHAQPRHAGQQQAQRRAAYAAPADEHVNLLRINHFQCDSLFFGCWWCGRTVVARSIAMSDSDDFSDSEDAFTGTLLYAQPGAFTTQDAASGPSRKRVTRPGEADEGVKGRWACFFFFPPLLCCITHRRPTPDKIQIMFVTKLTDLVVPQTPFEVPARFARLGLSEVINHLLRLEAPVPFDFLINGEVRAKRCGGGFLVGVDGLVCSSCARRWALGAVARAPSRR